MQSLDRLGWADGLVLACQGARVGVRVDRTAVLKQLAERFPPGWEAIGNTEVDALLSVRMPEVSAAARRTFCLLYRGATRVARTLDRAEFADLFESHLHQTVAEQSPRLFIHAGVVGWRGKALVLPGRSLAGKTTLVAALVRAGAEYYSDEYAVVDERGWVHPYPKHLGVRTTGTIKQTRRSAADLGGKIGSVPLPVGAVIMTEFRSDTSWRPRRQSAGRAVLSLLKHSASVHRRPQVAMGMVKQMVVSSVLLRGARGEAERAAPEILAYLERIG